MPPKDASSTAIVVSELFPPAVGGSAVLIENVYSRFSRASVDVLADSAASGAGAGAHPSGLRVVTRPIATRHRGVLARGALRHHLRVAREIRNLTRGRERVVVHVVRALPEGLAALLARTTTRVPYVCWCHGEEVATALTSRELTAVMRVVYRGAVGVIANSRHTATLLDSIGVDRAKVHVVHPGVDAGRFTPQVDGTNLRQRLAPSGDFVILTTGRLQRRKGHDVAIDAVARLAPRMPGLRYVIVGDGEERPVLEAQVRRLGLERHVHFAGELPSADLPACYAACDLFVMPNRVDGVDVEGFGIVFLEAAASGRPSIGGNSGGVPEAVADSETGLLVSGTDAGELADRISAMIRDTSLRERLAHAGRARAVRDFSWDRAAASVMALHERLAG